MKKLIVILSVVFNGVLNAQPNSDSLSKLPFFNCPTTKDDLKVFNFDEVYDVEKLGEVLSERYGCEVGCENFFESDGFTDVVVYLRPFYGDMYECYLITSLSIVEKLFMEGVLLDNVKLYYDICKRTYEY
jgi:hypothetical protein